MTLEDLRMDVGTLSAWLAEGRPVTVLDVRPKSEREEWSIPGSLHADVYDKVKANDPTAFDNIDITKNTPVVTVCAAGKTSLKAAELLKLKGFEVYSLDGGMKAWNFAYNIAEADLGNAKVVQVRRSSKGVISYIIGSNGEAMVIDAALDPQVYIDLAQSNGWSIKYVTDTHIHADFISRTRELASATLAKHLMIESAIVGYPLIPLKDGEQIKVGDISITAIHTPGHTMESTSFKLGDSAVFTGDTLFVDGIGRPDLKADSDEAIKRSKLLYQSLLRLMKLNHNTLVLPGHTAAAIPFDGRLIGRQIARLKDKLEMLQLSKDDFVTYTTSRIPPTPPNYLTIAGLNKQGFHDGHSRLDLEAGANRCAIS